MSLLEDEIKPTPRNYILGLLADAAQRANETVSRPAGYDNPPGRILMSLLGVPAIAQTLDRLSYGEPLTTGRGMTTKVRPEAMEAAMAIAPGVGPATKATAKAAKAAAKELGPKAADIAERYMMEQGLAKPMIVWHGSPHKFEKFDASKIGTGEGAQAYGHGLYLAESPDVAKAYQPRDPNLEQRIMQRYSQAEKAKDYPAMQVYEDYLLHKTPMDVEQGLKEAGFEGKDLASALRAHNIAKREYFNQRAGSLYKVDLPDEQIAKMLDWDKPLSEQTEYVRKALEALGYKYDKAASNAYSDALLSALEGDATLALPKMPRNPQGSEIARGQGIFDAPKDKVIAEKLRQAGIPGIRYLDQGSRGAGQGTSNFVVFPGEEELLKILERNGIPIESLL